MCGKKIPIKDVMDVTLQMVFLTMQHTSGSQGDKEESISHMLYSLEETKPMVFNWEESLVVTFKEKLTKCRPGELNLFGYGTILVSLFFERVQNPRSQVAFTELRAHDPCMLRWL